MSCASTLVYLLSPSIYLVFILYPTSSLDFLFDLFFHRCCFSFDLKFHFIFSTVPTSSYTSLVLLFLASPFPLICFSSLVPSFPLFLAITLAVPLSTYMCSFPRLLPVRSLIPGHDSLDLTVLPLFIMVPLDSNREKPRSAQCRERQGHWHTDQVCCRGRQGPGKAPVRSILPLLFLSQSVACSVERALLVFTRCLAMPADESLYCPLPPSFALIPTLYTTHCWDVSSAILQRVLWNHCAVDCHFPLLFGMGRAVQWGGFKVCSSSCIASLSILASHSKLQGKLSGMAPSPHQLDCFARVGYMIGGAKGFEVIKVSAQWVHSSCYAGFGSWTSVALSRVVKFSLVSLSCSLSLSLSPLTFYRAPVSLSRPLYSFS